MGVDAKPNWALIGAAVAGLSAPAFAANPFVSETPPAPAAPLAPAADRAPGLAPLADMAPTVAAAPRPLQPPRAPKPAAPPVESDAPHHVDERQAVLEIGRRPEFTRLSFRWPSETTVAPIQKGDRIDLHFSRSADIDIADLRVLPPPFVKDAKVTSKAGAPLVISLIVEPGVKQRHFVEGPRAIVDLLAPPEKPAAPEHKTAEAPPPAAAKSVKLAPDPAPKGGVVRVGYNEDMGEIRLSTHWAGPARVAAFRRGEGIWILFDSAAKLDISAVSRVTKQYTDVSPVAGDGYVGIRISAPASTLVSAESKDNDWTFILAKKARAPSSGVSVQRDTGAGPAGLRADFGQPGVVRWIADPVIGDRFAAALVTGPARGVEGQRATLEAAILSSAQGAAVEARADGVGARFDGDVLVVARGLDRPSSAAPQTFAGPSLLQALDDVSSASGAGGSALLDLHAWKGAPKRNVVAAIAQLQRAAAVEGVASDAPNAARITLARFLLANELAPEALGALRHATLNKPALDSEPGFRLMRAVANIMLGRYEDAQPDLAAGSLTDDPTAALWRGYVAAQAENWTEARRNLDVGQSAMSTQTEDWRARFHLALAQAALRLNDFSSAEAAAAAAAGEARDAATQGEARLVQARLAQARGDDHAALAVFRSLAVASDEKLAVRASLDMIRTERRLSLISPEAAADALEALRFRWRGDGLELETIQTLGQVYADLGRWRDALNVMRAASVRFPDLPAARQIRIDMASLFQRLFLAGEADKLEPIQALGLFYEFKELTPVGADGDKMIRLLAGRLTRMDLLEKASELLQHQVDNRLAGVAQAQVAIDLAAIYIADQKPRQALTAIDSTRQPGVPPLITGERRIIEAEALMALSDFDHAEELLEKDKSLDADRIRAEAAWRRKDWPRATALIEIVLDRTPPEADGLSADSRKLVLRAIAACLFSQDMDRLEKIKRRYGEAMAKSPDADAFDLIASGADPGDARIGDVARIIARSDLVDRFMARIKAEGEPRAPASPAGGPAVATPVATGATPTEQPTGA